VAVSQSTTPGGTPARDPDPASAGTRADPTYGPPDSYRRGALAALVVAVVGVGAFLYGVRAAVQRIPPDAEARAAVRRDSLLRARGGGATARPGQGGGGAQPDELPRLR
jgi:hypothetical protein